MPTEKLPDGYETWWYLKVIAEELTKIRKEISYASTTRTDNK